MVTTHSLLLVFSLLALTLASGQKECPAEAMDALCNGVQSNDFSKVSEFLGEWSTASDVLNSGLCGGISPLALAAAMGHVGIVETLLMLDGVIDVNLNVGGTALMMATSEGQTAAVELLLKHKNIDVNIVEPSTGGNALQAAALLGHADIVKQLLKKSDVDVNWPSNDGISPLMMAARGSHVEVVDLLLADDRVDINVVDNSNSNVLTTVLGVGNGAIAITVLDSPKLVNVNQQNDAKLTPLMQSSLMGLTSVVDSLLHKNADVNVKGKDDWTALLYAIAKSHTEVVRLLLTVEGIDVNAECTQGWTASTLANHLQLNEIIDMLEAIEIAY